MPLSTFEYSSSNIPAFLSKLWTLVEDKKYDELIAWDPSGYSFHVFDQTRFAREILPRFFKHNNMASFIRQLNMYGFRKVNSIEHGSLKNEKDDMEFHHPYFIRNKEHFLEFIKRKVSSGSSQPIKKEDLYNNSGDNKNNKVETTNDSSKKELNRSNPDLVSLLHGVKTMQDTQSDVVNRLEYLKRENEALWKEVATLRQKHHHQQQIVNKLIHFLVHLVNPTMGIKRTRPLMIDSHATLTNINDNSNEPFLLDNNKISKKIKLTNIDYEDEPNTKQMRYENGENTESSTSRKNSFNGTINTNSNNSNCNASSNKGIIIDDVSDKFIKSALSSVTSANYNNNNSNNDINLDENNEIKVPFVDLVSDSPTSNQLDDDDDVDAEAEDFLNSSLFLNDNTTSTTSSNIPSNGNLTTLNDNSKDLKLSNNNNNNEGNIIYEPQLSIATPRPTDSVLKRSISSSQLLDHVEAFQIDLSSIKDMLTTQTNFDNSLLENVTFSSDTNLDNFHYNLTNNTHADEESKINGNEVVHYDQINPDMLFSIDDGLLVNNDEDGQSYLTSSHLQTIEYNNNNNQNSNTSNNNANIFDLQTLNKE